MAAGERKNSEDLESYRKRLAREHKETKEKIAGRMLWLSAALVHKTEDKSAGFGDPMYKVNVHGTYNKDRDGKIGRDE